MKFKIVFTGSSAVERIQFDIEAMSEESAVRRVSEKLPYYYPVYYAAGIYDEFDQLVRELTAKVVVS